MTSETWFVVLLAAVALERVVELVVSSRNIRAARALGGVERGLRHYPVMVALHLGLLAGSLLEMLVANRPFIPGLGWPMLGLVLAAQALRWWCITTLGPAWSTRVVVVPGVPLVRTGPYRWLRHPNYIAVLVEGVALPLVHSAWLTAVLFTSANGLLLRTRIRCEEAALAELARPAAATAASGR